eukprot:2010000-Rhodomonas_salina.2
MMLGVGLDCEVDGEAEQSHSPLYRVCHGKYGARVVGKRGSRSVGLAAYSPFRPLGAFARCFFATYRALGRNGRLEIPTLLSRVCCHNSLRPYYYYDMAYLTLPLLAQPVSMSAMASKIGFNQCPGHEL